MLPRRCDGADRRSARCRLVINDDGNWSGDAIGEVSAPTFGIKSRHSAAFRGPGGMADIDAPRATCSTGRRRWRHFISTAEVAQVYGISPAPYLRSLDVARTGKLISVTKGGWIPVPAEYRSAGAPHRATSSTSSWTTSDTPLRGIPVSRGHPRRLAPIADGLPGGDAGQAS